MENELIFEDESTKIWKSKKGDMMPQELDDKTSLFIDAEKEEAFQVRIYPLIIRGRYIQFSSKRNKETNQIIMKCIFANSSNQRCLMSEDIVLEDDLAYGDKIVSFEKLFSRYLFGKPQIIDMVGYNRIVLGKIKEKGGVNEDRKNNM